MQRWPTFDDRRRRSGDFAWSMLAAALALADVPLRLSRLLTVPRVGDEWGEILLGYRIFRGEVLPLHNRAHDIGPLFNYLLALLFHIFGVSLSLPRLTVMVISIVTVFLTYLLGRALFGRTVGLLASALLATDNVDILVTHMAWSNDITPFLVVGASLLTVEARTKGGAFYPLAGFGWAMALQSHSSVLAFLPGILFLVWRSAPRPRLRQLWVWAGHGAFLLGYLNMIVWNIIHPLDSLKWILTRKHYAVASAMTPAAYLHHALLFWEEIARSLATASMTGTLFLHHAPPPIVLAVLALFVAGMIVAYRRGDLLLPILFLGPALLFPALDKSYAFIVDGRYIDPLLPLGLIAVALGFVEGAGALVRSIRASRSRAVATGAVGALALALVLSPVPSLGAYYAREARLGVTNAPYLALARELRGGDGGRLILLDSTCAFARVLPDVLAVEGLSVQEVGDPWTHSGRGSFALSLWRRALRRHPRALVVASPQDFRRLAALMRTFARRRTWSNGDYVVARRSISSGGV